MGKKSSRKMLMKLTTGVNITNVWTFGFFAQTFWLVFFAETIYCIWGKMVFGQWRTDVANVNLLIWLKYCWWNWIANFFQVLCAGNFWLGAQSLLKSTSGINFTNILFQRKYSRKSSLLNVGEIDYIRESLKEF